MWGWDACVARVLFIWLPCWGNISLPNTFGTRATTRVPTPHPHQPLPLQRTSLGRCFTGRSHGKGGSGCGVGTLAVALVVLAATLTYISVGQRETRPPPH